MSWWYMTLSIETTYPVDQFRKYVLIQNSWNKDCLRKYTVKGHCNVSLIEVVIPLPQGEGRRYSCTNLHTCMHTHIQMHTIHHTHTHSEWGTDRPPSHSSSCYIWTLRVRAALWSRSRRFLGLCTIWSQERRSQTIVRSPGWGSHHPGDYDWLRFPRRPQSPSCPGFTDSPANLWSSAGLSHLSPDTKGKIEVFILSWNIQINLPLHFVF